MKFRLFCSKKAKWYKQILRLIALTHDLGHAPFSHASEALFEDQQQHEDYTKKILFETEIAQYVRDIGSAFRCEHGQEYDITPELLWLIYGEDNPEFNEEYIMPDFKFLKSFMDSELDCDKMDYLLRDSYYCGVNYGKYDLERLLSSLSVYTKHEHNIMQLAIESGGIHVFEEFVIARYFMFIQVYFHKTRRFLDRLLVKSISNTLPKGIYPDDVVEYLKLDDQTIMGQIKERQDKCAAAELFVKRKVMTCVYQTNVHGNLDTDNQMFDKINKGLQKALGCDTVTDTAIKLAHKMPIMEQYDFSSGKGIPVLLPHTGKPTNIMARSILLQSLRESINIKRIYVDKLQSAQAKQIVAGLLQEEEDDQ